MGFDIPDEVYGVAAGVLVYSFICEIAGALLVWLVWSHRERTSYVAWIAYFTLLSTTASIIQQFHVYTNWTKVVTKQFQHAKLNAGNPELVIANSSRGADLVLFYIQYCCYNIEATFVVFWAFSLTQSVYGWSAKPHLRRTFKYINRAGKGISVILPIIMISLLQTSAVQRTFTGFLIVADILLIISLACGCGFVLAILAKYVQSRRQFKSWSIGYGKGSGSSDVEAPESGGGPSSRSKGIYDRWLMVRFTLGFIFLGAFELTNVLFQLAGRENTTIDALSDKPDLSASRATSTAVLFLPGVTPPLLAFLVFGTTTPFRKSMYQTFLPRRFQCEPTSSRRVPNPRYASQDSKTGGLPSRNASMHGAKAREADISLSELKIARAQRTIPHDFEDEWPILKAVHSSHHIRA
ncbi:hypothetical protein F5Y15DRAFT_416455 [Xylariaceae sp. FL0016]|nr:hypothetical protein F5Y15DRAFT_416455 [Xylariaceae sp. FL0016]